MPAENVLGEVGKGHKVAFNVLNFGRFKLGAMCGGGAIGAIAESAKYAATRKQFGQPIATFGAIKHKLGEMVVAHLRAREPALSHRRPDRCADRRDAARCRATARRRSRRSRSTPSRRRSPRSPAARRSNYVLDENIQIHGGNGFVHDYPAERHYRDARVNRIFEGTNEINRLLIPGMLIRRALKGDLPLIPAAKALQDEMLDRRRWRPDDADGVLADERARVARSRKTALMVFGLAMQTYGTKLTDEQEVLSTSPTS